MIQRLVRPKQLKTSGAFGKLGFKEVEYQYQDVYQKKSKRTGMRLVGKTLVGY